LNVERENQQKTLFHTSIHLFSLTLFLTPHASLHAIKLLLEQESVGRHFLVRQNHYGHSFCSSEATLVSFC
jgi:hypothetical protein